MEWNSFLAFFCKLNCNFSFNSLNKLVKYVNTAHNNDTSVTFNDCAKLHCSQCKLIKHIFYVSKTKKVMQIFEKKTFG